MPVANRDSSELTRARRAMTLYGYVNALNTAQASSNIVRREQTTSQTSVVHVEARQGACYCAAVSAGTYILGGKSDPGACGCSRGT